MDISRELAKAIADTMADAADQLPRDCGIAGAKIDDTSVRLYALAGRIQNALNADAIRSTARSPMDG